MTSQPQLTNCEASGLRIPVPFLVSRVAKFVEPIGTINEKVRYIVVGWLAMYFVYIATISFYCSCQNLYK